MKSCLIGAIVVHEKHKKRIARSLKFELLTLSYSCPLAIQGVILKAHEVILLLTFLKYFYVGTLVETDYLPNCQKSEFQTMLMKLSNSLGSNVF